ncbi:uncharacterized protein LOC130649456 [Hydractinia symbiolongicarpus]|uniref:uncharacterized protein LOC130649456 n=1 Tax=Hydractinia symbiolongicarpus TaxID=13093 RepID=UPI0025505AA8|nr:uncharacterized protein LOC130649456 [Hydractinia symbiolongicarpus]
MRKELSLLDLPECIWSFIASYLHLEDFRNYRLTCLLLCQSTYSRTAMQNINIRIIFDGKNNRHYGYGRRFISTPKVFPCLATFMSKLLYGKISNFVKISPLHQNVPEFVFENLLNNSLKDVTEVKTYVEHVGIIGKCCLSLQKLQLNTENLVLNRTSPFNDHDKTTLTFLDASSFKSFPSLHELSISNMDFRLNVLTWILDGIPTLASFILLRVTFGLHTSIQTEKEREAIQKCVSQVTNIWHWSWEVVEIADHLELFLPDSVSSFKCRLKSNFLKWKPENIKKFSFEKYRDFDKFMIPWNPEKYVNLTHLTFNYAEFHDSNFPLCANVKFLKLSWTKNTLAYLGALSLYPADALRKLILIYPRDFVYDSKFANILTSFCSLEYVEVVEGDESFDTIQHFVDELSAMKPRSLKYFVFPHYNKSKKIVRFKD